MKFFDLRADMVPPEKASVEVILGKSDGSKIHFKRIVNAKGVASYYVNDSQYDHDEYVSELEEHRLLAQTRTYFLVMQGEIDLVLQNSSKDLASIIEEISGSKLHKNQYDSLQQKLEQIQAKITEISKNLQELRKEKRKAKGIKANILSSIYKYHPS